MMMISYPTAEDLARSLNARRAGDGWVAQCVAHEDAKASLSIGQASDGSRTLWKCHAGCDQETVRDALISRGLWPTNATVRARPIVKAVPVASSRLVATYQYRDENYVVVHETLRYEPKRFSQRAVLPDGSHVYSLKDVRTVLYGLPELLAWTDTWPVWIVEGEKDADNLNATGAIATTVPMGAGKWKKHYGEWFRGRDVRIIPDNDEAGRKGAMLIATALVGVARSVGLVTLPIDGKGSDVTDYLATGATLDDLEALPVEFVEADALAVAVAVAVTGSVVPDEAMSIDWQPLTDLGNAERLIARHGRDLRYVHAMNSWFVWDGAVWLQDATGGVMRLAAEMIRELTNVASADRSPDMPSARRTALVKHAEKSESRQRLEACIKLAQNLEGVAMRVNQLDQHTHLFNVANGTVDTTLDIVRPHRREDYMTQIQNFRGVRLPYYPEREYLAYMPVTNAFLARIFPNPEVRAFVQRAIGYAITGSVSERCMIVCYGSGRNGKSTLLEFVRDIIGDDYCRVVPSEILMARKAPSSGSASPDLASLRGARLVVCAETEQGGRLNEGQAKWLTGDDTIQARRLYEGPITFRPTHTIFLTTNHQPTIRDGGEAIYDRMHMLVFEVRIPDDEVDRELPARLRSEAEHALAWALKGAHQQHLHGLNPPKPVLAATATYRSEQDWFAPFLDEKCEIAANLTVASSDLHTAYNEWAAASSERTLNPTQFGGVMRGRGFASVKSSRIYWRGVGLRAE